MGAREELTSILRDAAEAAIAGGLPVLTYEGYADAAVIAGWRPPPRVITDPAGLGDVPDGSVILDALGVPRQLTGHLGRHGRRFVTTPAGAAARHRAPNSADGVNRSCTSTGEAGRLARHRTRPPAYLSCLFGPGRGWADHPPPSQPLTDARAVGTWLPAYPVRVNPPSARGASRVARRTPGRLMNWSFIDKCTVVSSSM